MCGYLLRAIQVCKVYAILKRIAGINNGELKVSQNKLSIFFMSTFILFIVPLLLYHNSCTHFSFDALHNSIRYKTYTNESLGNLWNNYRSVPFHC